MSDGKALYGRLVEAMNAHDLETIGAGFSADCEVITPNATLRRREQFKAFMASIFAALPDATVTVHNMVLEGPLLAVDYTLSGTFTGSLRLPTGEIPPTGKPFINPVFELNRFEGDYIVTSHLYADRLAQRIQFGLMPDPTSAR
jgi:predicted ester cyclase